MNKDLYEKILEAIIDEASLMATGAVGGVSTPLGTGPKAGSRGENIYKSSKSTDKKHRSKKRKESSKTDFLNKAPQYYIQKGPAKGRKRSFKEVYNFLSEARSARIKDLTKSEIIAFLNYLKGQVDENIKFSTTEKIAGQAMTVGIRGTVKGNEVYCAIKDRLLSKNNNIFDPSFYKSKGTSGLVKTAFLKNFRRLNPGEEIILNMEIIINDKRKPDYIAYEVPYGTEYAAIFGINPVNSFTKLDAQKLSGSYYNRRRRRSYTLEVLLPEDIPLIPNISIDDSIKEEIDELIETVKNLRYTKKLGPDFPVKADIEREISPRVRSLVKSIFPSSNINASSPIEGIAVNLTSGENSKFFKVPNEDFDKLQSIQANVYAEFKTNRYGTSQSRSKGFIDQLNNPKTSQSFARNVFKLIKYLNEVEVLPLNYRTFFKPDNFRLMCKLMLEGLQKQDKHKIAKSLDLISKQLYTSKGHESFKSIESENLTQFIEKNNLI